MRTKGILTAVLPVVFILVGCTDLCKHKDMKVFIDKHVATVRPVITEAALAGWEADRSGKDEDFGKKAKLELRITTIYSNRSEFEYLKRCKDTSDDPVIARQAQLLYLTYLANQIDPALNKQIVELGNQISQKFNVYRGKIDGKEYTSNQLLDILREQTDSAVREKAWQASKQVGSVLAEDIIRLVKLRNKAAGSLGFDNFHTFSLKLSEQDPQEIDRIFEQLDKLTEKPFKQLKAEIDTILAHRYGVEADKLGPWHYEDPFFQEAPQIYTVDLDAYYKGRDIAALAKEFYAGIGLPVDTILARSDLFERPGKNPHAFCTDIDMEGDVRILCNIRDDEKWMETVLHELGHAVYDRYFSPEVPYLLRGPAHTFTTEGIAMFFGRLSGNEVWMQQTLGLTDQQKQDIASVSNNYLRLKQLVFARWAMVMYNFEKSLYADPDQDLNRLWWDMVEKYQFVKRPQLRNQPDWASKYHIASAPCYYHNYMLGELLASQLYSHVTRQILNIPPDTKTGFAGQTKLGDFLRNNVFEPGKRNSWNRMIKDATGEELNPKYFVEQFITGQ